MEDTCDVVHCSSTDRNGIVEIGYLTFHVCLHHIKVIRGETQTGIVKVPSIIIDEHFQLIVMVDGVTV